MRITLTVLMILLLVAGGVWAAGLLSFAPATPRHRMAGEVRGQPINAPLDDENVAATASAAVDPRVANDQLPSIDFQPRPEHAAYKPIGFDRLTSFPYRRWWPDAEKPLDQQKPPDQFPPEIKALNGKPVTIAGFLNVLDPDEKGRASRFMLMRNQLLCCFGAPLTLQDWIDIRMKNDEKVVPILHVPVFVLGTLEVGEENIDGYTVSIYRMTADKILPPGVLP